MDIKDLNKSQLIMLSILLSFVISIATGITVVTLMEQAPSSLTVPINRVVRQTVEKIQQVEGKTTVQTVVVKEEDLVVDAISKNQSASFSVTKEAFDGAVNATSEVSAGRGFAILDSGIVAVDALLVPETGTYFLKNESGKFKADFVFKDPAGFSYLKIGDPVDGQSKVSYTVPVFGDLSKMKTGQKVIVFGSSIASFIFEGGADIKISGIDKSKAGGMVLNLDGEVIGMALSGEVTSFAPINSIKDSFDKYKTSNP